MDFHITVDFNDDLNRAAGEWNEQKLREAVRCFADRGISAIHWIDYGPADSGMWDHGSYFDRDGRACRFFQQVPHPLRVVCDEAHSNGLRVFAVLKVFDLAIGMPSATYPVGTGPDPPVGLPHIGGQGSCAIRWLREHPDKRARLHPSLWYDGVSERQIGTIRLWHETDALSTAPPVEIFVSNDNDRYRRYDGPVSTSLSVRRRRPPVFVPAPDVAFGREGAFSCLELTGMAISEPFLCLQPTKPVELANTLAALVEVADTHAQAIPFTYGLAPTQPREVRDSTWLDVGIAFDAARLTPVPGRGIALKRSGGRIRINLAECGSLGIARGRNEYLTGMVEMAYPEVRNWLTGIMLEALDAGADGVDIRLANHTESLDWENYGFNPPIIEEFKRRCGVDIATEPFDRASWRRLRGEYFETFLKEAGRAVRRRGGEFLVHLEEPMERPAEKLCYMEIFWDWREWLRDGLVDRANFKGSTLDGPLRREALQLCRELGIPKITTPKFLMSTTPESELEPRMGAFIDRALQDGFDSLNLYESATVMRLEADGSLNFTAPSLWKRIVQLART